MKLSSSISSLALVALFASAPLLASSMLRTETATTVVVDEDEDTPLQEAMTALKKGQRGMKKLIADPAANQDALLGHLRSMESAIIVAMGETVPVPKGVEGQDLELFKVGYKREMSNLLVRVFDLQLATIRKDAAGLKSGYDALVAVKKTGHDTYQE